MITTLPEMKIQICLKKYHRMITKPLDYNKSKGFFVYDNAVCMQGFAAECALKSIFQQCISRENVVKYGHNIKLLLQDILRMNIISRKMLLSVGRMHQPISGNVEIIC